MTKLLAALDLVQVGAIKIMEQPEPGGREGGREGGGEGGRTLTARDDFDY